MLALAHGPVHFATKQHLQHIHYNAGTGAWSSALCHKTASTAHSLQCWHWRMVQCTLPQNSIYSTFTTMLALAHGPVHFATKQHLQHIHYNAGTGTWSSALCHKTASPAHSLQCWHWHMDQSTLPQNSISSTFTTMLALAHGPVHFATKQHLQHIHYNAGTGTWSSALCHKTASPAHSLQCWHWHMVQCTLPQNSISSTCRSWLNIARSILLLGSFMNTESLWVHLQTVHQIRKRFHLARMLERRIQNIPMLFWNNKCGLGLHSFLNELTICSETPAAQTWHLTHYCTLKLKIRLFLALDSDLCYNAERKKNYMSKVWLLRSNALHVKEACRNSSWVPDYPRADAYSCFLPSQHQWLPGQSPQSWPGRWSRGKCWQAWGPGESCSVTQHNCLETTFFDVWNKKNKRRANFTFIILIYWAVQWSWFARVNALCNLLCMKSRQVALSLLGWFLCRHCFTPWITMEVEHRIVKQYYCHHCCCCKNYRGKEMEGGKKVSLHRFSADQKIAISWKKCILGHPTARATSYCLLPDTFWLQASKNVFKVGSVKFANSLSPPSIVKKVCTRSKSSQGT